MIVADLHIHSHYSRATSKDLTFPHLWKWAQLKGVTLLGTGDIAHPGWLAEMRDLLEPAEEGLFRLRVAPAALRAEVPATCQREVRFMLAGEISNIYKKHDAVRKVHNVIFAPSLEAVAQIQTRLEKIGNIRSDGRPILGLDSRDLFEIILDVDERCQLIPAHIWTPWFSLLGSKSGFDCVRDCFDDLTDRIVAVETGLSSDPPMNWRVSQLDPYTLVSHSDAHSPQKLAREATLFDTEYSYDAIFAALASGDPARFRGTVEFFPEEGKYHLDGHRNCAICWHPQTTRAHDGRCAVCGKPVTIGVLHRVETLADRPEGARPPRAHPFHSLIPLPEIIAEIKGVGVNTKTTQAEYMRLLSALGPELSILMELPLEQIAAVASTQLAEGIGRMRRGEVHAEGGYDGEYGTVKLFAGVDPQSAGLQLGMFKEEAIGDWRLGTGAEQTEPMSPHSPPFHHPIAQPLIANSQSPIANSPSLNNEQRAAVHTVDRPLMIVAGPGTGKTRTLTARIGYLLAEADVQPESILAITFTNRAAEEMATRLADLVGGDCAARVTVKTFHALGAALLQQWGAQIGIDPNFVILAEDQRARLLRQTCPSLSAQTVELTLTQISAAKNRLIHAADLVRMADPSALLAMVGHGANGDFVARYDAYQRGLAANHALDFDDLLLQTVYLLEICPAVLLATQERFRWLSVDEYQDVNLAQYRLLKLLAAGGADLCVIGDPDQAIYSFRGADPRYFAAFVQDFPGARTVHLTQNYRSAQAILSAATQVIGHNADRKAVQLLASFASQVALHVYSAASEQAEAETVVHQIEQMVGGTSYFSLDSGRIAEDAPHAVHSFGDFAVLYRLNAQRQALQEAFERSGIPYQTVGQTPFYAQKSVRRLLAPLWLWHNPASQPHWEVLLPDGDGAPLCDLLRAQSGPLAQRLSEALYADAIARPWRQPLLDLIALFAHMENRAGQSVADLVAWLHEHAAVGSPCTAQDLARVVERARGFGRDLRGFLEATALSGEADLLDPRADRVLLMTIHAAKGLEFSTVLMVGCEEGLLPYTPGKAQEAIAEERRLFYVGMTRAQHRLILTHARWRFLFGQAQENRLSRFVNEIEEALYQGEQPVDRPKPVRAEERQLSLF